MSDAGSGDAGSGDAGAVDARSVDAGAVDPGAPNADAARAALTELRRIRSADAAALYTSLADVRAARSDGTADDEHDPEGSTLTSDWSRLAGLSAAARDELAAIDRALGRLDAGAYGTCLRCAAPIGAGRLVARPAAEHCIDCARALERR